MTNDTTAPRVNWRYFFVLCAIGALGGVLFGFDTAVISGTVLPLKAQFNLSAGMEGWTASCVLLGCVLGAGAAGGLSDAFGRKPVMLLSAALFLISALGCSLAPSLTFLITSRIVGGLGVGIAGMVAPLYIAEISPPRYRGRMVGMYQLAICLGVLAAYLTNHQISLLADRMEITEPLSFVEWQLTEIWRAMFGSEVLPAVLYGFVLLLVPESPRYLIKVGKDDRAEEILARISGTEVARQELVEIRETIAHESGSLQQLFEPGVGRATIVALYLAIFSQLSGIDAIIYYGPSIFKSAGFDNNTDLVAQIVIGIVLVVFTLLAMWTVDTLGRKKLMLWGNVGVFLALILMAIFFYLDVTKGHWLVFCISLFIASFAFSLGPIPWIVMAEIFPTKIRGRAIGFATLVLFGSTGMVTLVFPWMLENLEGAGTFGVFAVLALPTFVFVWKVMPETRGRTLEEIEQSWTKSKTGE
jgi:SP family arabinose:H+ symporter-like MFS transporter